MIIRASFRAPGGLAAHLARGDTNAGVIVRTDVSQGCELEIRAAVNDFAALGDVEKSLVHIVVSPPIALTDAQLQRTLEVVRNAYGVSPAQPAIVIEHVKPGEMDRPSHFHVVLPRRDVRTGRLIRDSWYRTKSDRVAVQLDAEFSAPAIVPITHKASVETWLATNDPETLAAIEARGGLKAPLKGEARTTAREKQRATGAGVDPAAFAARVLSAYDAMKGRPDEAAWLAAGLTLARGDKCAMIVDADTGHTAALARTLNAAAKRAVDPRRWRASELRHLIDQAAPSLSAAVAARSVDEQPANVSEPKLAARVGRPPRATPAEIADEKRRRRELRRSIAAEIARINEEAGAARATARDLSRQIATIDRIESNEVAAGLGAASFITFLSGPAATAAAAFLLLIFRQGRRAKLDAQRRAALTAADVRARIVGHFAAIRTRYLTAVRGSRAPERSAPERAGLQSAFGVTAPAPSAQNEKATAERGGQPSLSPLSPAALDRMSTYDRVVIHLAVAAALDVCEGDHRIRGADADRSRGESGRRQLRDLEPVVSPAVRATFDALTAPISSQAQIDALIAASAHLAQETLGADGHNALLAEVGRQAGGDVARIVETELARNRAREHD